MPKYEVRYSDPNRNADIITADTYSFEGDWLIFHNKQEDGSRALVQMIKVAPLHHLRVVPS